LIAGVGNLRAVFTLTREINDMKLAVHCFFPSCQASHSHMVKWPHTLIVHIQQAGLQRGRRG